MDIITIGEQTRLFLLSLLVGAGLAALYDLFRILRVAFVCGKGLVAFQDILYWLLCAFATFTFVLCLNQGAVRFYILLGEGLGWVIYHLTLGSLVMACSHGVIALARRLAGVVDRCFLRPVRRLLRWLLRPVAELWTGLLAPGISRPKKVGQDRKYTLQHRRHLLYNLFKK